MNAVFITGTDTEVGKTVVCGLLGRYLQDQGQNVITQKWIQTGSADFPEDIDTHLKWMGKNRDDIQTLLPLVVPYVFKLPASAHLAAAAENKQISDEKIKDSFTSLSKEHDFVIVEGIGGALVPYNEKKCVIDIAAELGLPVIIVAKNKLGAINHTLLTIEAIQSRGMKILGIVFNSQEEKEDEKILDDNPRIIGKLTPQTILGRLPWSRDEDLLINEFAAIGENISAELQRK